MCTDTYLLNTVDESDLAALVKDYTPAAPTPTAETDTDEVVNEDDALDMKAGDLLNTKFPSSE